MTSGQKIIKYIAIAIAIFLIINIIGIILTIFAGLGIFFNVKEAITNTENFEEVIDNYPIEEITNLDIEINYSKLEIKNGDTFKIECNNEKIYTEKKGNKIEIKEKNNWFNKQETSNITIYIPENKIFERTEIEAGAGEINIDKLQTNNLTFSIGAGKVQINELEVFEKAEIEGGAGKADIISEELHNLDLEMGLGELNLTTKLIGNNVIEQGIGKLSINLTDNIENYKIRTSKGLGSITIDGNEVQDGNTYGNGENNIRIEGGMGAIEIVTNSPEGQSI